MAQVTRVALVVLLASPVATATARAEDPAPRGGEETVTGSVKRRLLGGTVETRRVERAGGDGWNPGVTVTRRWKGRDGKTRKVEHSIAQELVFDTGETFGRERSVQRTFRRRDGTRARSETEHTRETAVPGKPAERVLRTTATFFDRGEAVTGQRSLDHTETRNAGGRWSRDVRSTASGAGRRLRLPRLRLPRGR